MQSCLACLFVHAELAESTQVFTKWKVVDANAITLSPLLIILQVVMKDIMMRLDVSFSEDTVLILANIKLVYRF